MFQRLPHVGLFLLLLTATLAPPASAQTEPDAAVWDSPRVVQDFLILTNNTTLTVRGTTLGLTSGFRVNEGSRLILESTPEAPAKLVATDADGYQAVVLGAIEIRGLPEHPVVMDGGGGRAQTHKEFILVEGGIDIAGELTADHLVVQNYTAGIRVVVPDAHAEIRDVTFRSAQGVGLMLAAGTTAVDGATFEGAGATLWTTLPAEFSIQNARFRDSDTPIAVNGGTGDLANITVDSNVTRCLKALSGDLVIEGFVCTGYAENGLQFARSSSGRDALVLADGVHVHSTNASAGAAINAVRVKRLEIRNSTLGPVAHNAVRLEKSQAVLDNVTFQDAGEYNVFLVDPPAAPPYERLGSGGPGGAGWLLASGTAGANVRLPDLEPAPEATLTFHRQSDGRVVSAQVLDESGRSQGVLLEFYRIEPSGDVTAEKYEVRAADETGRYLWERKDYVPSEGRLEILLKEAHALARPTPFPAPLALVALALAIVTMRRK